MVVLHPYAGYIVRVTTTRFSGKITHIPCIVCEWEPEKAEQVIRGVAAPGESVKAILQLPRSIVDRFDLKPGEFTPFGAAGRSRARIKPAR